MKKLLLLALMVLFALPAFAFNIYNTPEGDKVDIYGSIRMAAGYQNSQGYAKGKFSTKTSDLLYDMFGTSRLGVDFKIDKFFGTAEFNFSMDGSGKPGFGFRQLFAGYDFGNGHKFTFGQKTVLSGTSAAFGDFWFADNSFAGFGVLSSIRRPALVYSYYGLDIGFVANTDIVETFGTDAYVKGPMYIPRFELAYNFKSGDNFKGKIAGSYGLYTEKSSADGAFHNINAWHVTALFQPTFGPGFFTATAFYSMNGAMYNMVKAMTTAGGVAKDQVLPDIVNGKVQDVHSYGIAVEGGYNINDIASFKIGAGWQSNMSAKYKTDGKNHDLNSYGAYVQTPIKLNKYMKIVPSVGYYSSFKSSTTKATRDEVSTLMAGAEFFVAF